MKKGNAKSGSSNVRGDWILRHASTVLSRKNSDGTVALMNIGAEEFFYSIDGIAAEFWMSLDGSKSVRRISESLKKKHHGMEPTQFDQAVTQLVRSLQKEGLVSRVRGRASP